MSDGQAIRSHVARWLWSLWSSHWVRVATSNMPHRHLKRCNRTAFQPRHVSNDCPGSWWWHLHGGYNIRLCVYRRHKAIRRRDIVLELDLPHNHRSLTTQTLRIPRSRHGRYLEQNGIRKSIDGRIDSGSRWGDESCTQVEALQIGRAHV